MSSPAQLLALLRCPVCRDPLANPTTLHCGHSVCSAHLPAAALSCPVPDCSSQPAADSPSIPADSPVRYSPAPSSVPVPLTPHRSDVVLNNILALLRRSLSPPPDIPRPRKRHKPRHPSPDPQHDLLAHLRSAAAQGRLVPPDRPLIPPPEAPSPLSHFDKLLLDELTCHICYVLFYQPVTTPCQHTFCAKCLQRSLDHSSVCPICRQDLPSLYFQDQPLNRTLLAIILQAFPTHYQDRRAAIEEEERHARLSTPIFVSTTLGFPGMTIMLHFFEPRYRLMLRRCLESSSPRFGIVMGPKPGYPQSDYGTMFEIRSVQMLPDGRSKLETRGTSRFRILERGTLDGYMVGRVERIIDDQQDIVDTPVLENSTPSPTPDRSLLNPLASSPSGSSFSISAASPVSAPSMDSHPAPSSSSPPQPLNPTHRHHQPTNEELMEICRNFLDRLQRGAAPWVVQRLSSTYGAMPEDPALFSFWVALVLPIEDHEKAKLLPIRSPRLRLMLVVHWIQQLNNNWYAWLCCFVLAPIEGWLLEGPAPLLLPLLLLLVFCGNYFGCLPFST